MPTQKAAAPAGVLVDADAPRDMLATWARARCPPLDRLVLIIAHAQLTVYTRKGREEAFARAHEALVAALAPEVGELEVVDISYMYSAVLSGRAPLMQLWKVADEEAYWRLPEEMRTARPSYGSLEDV